MLDDTLDPAVILNPSVLVVAHATVSLWRVLSFELLHECGVVPGLEPMWCGGTDLHRPLAVYQLKL